LIKNGKNGRIGDLELDQEHELAQLGSQFDSMLDQLEKRENEIQSAADQLEYKVVSRTASLNQKTQELEEHIELLNVTRDKLINNEKLAALGKLTAGIAHEINNPITVILGNIQLLQLDFANENPSVAYELENIVNQIDRITNITSSLLQYSRVGNELEMLTDENISDVLQKAITLVRTGTYVKNIDFFTHFSESETVQCNRNQLLQIIINVLMNAIQSMQGKGSLGIFTEDWLVGSKVNGAIIHIQDKGCGISSQEIAKVFEPFYTTKSDGTGLGLAVSLSLINLIGGKIEVTSKVGVGSTFSIFLKKRVIPDLDDPLME
jgi:two-component system NtrC family sensor kinase